MLRDYQLVVADWVPERDVVALEHVQPDTGNHCLVGATTLELTLEQVLNGVFEHERTCRHSRRQKRAAGGA